MEIKINSINKHINQNLHHYYLFNQGKLLLILISIFGGTDKKNENSNGDLMEFPYSYVYNTVPPTKGMSNKILPIFNNMELVMFFLR